MGFNCGIIGLPNVGKSTIFNALTNAGAQAANYPFCTIEPNTGIVPVPDPRLKVLAEIAGSKEIIPTTVEFVDIAGLVRGASKGEGLGNQFLGHIRSVDAVVHVVRCFDDENIVHVEGGVSPRRDVELIETELMLADLSAVEKRIERIQKLAKGGNKEAKEELDLLTQAREALGQGKSLRLTKDHDGNNPFLKLDLMTAKPLLYVANVAEDELDKDTPYFLELTAYAKEVGSDVVKISGKVESEVSALPKEEQEEFLSALGLSEPGLNKLIRAGYNLLNLMTFFTVGPKECHAWNCKNGSTGPQAAGKIHTDFEKGYIRAEVISYDDYVSCKGEQGAKDKGLLRVEGKAYLMQDGDIVHFRFNV